MTLSVTYICLETNASVIAGAKASVSQVYLKTKAMVSVSVQKRIVSVQSAIMRHASVIFGAKACVSPIYLTLRQMPVSLSVQTFDLSSGYLGELNQQFQIKEITGVIIINHYTSMVLAPARQAFIANSVQT